MSAMDREDPLIVENVRNGQGWVKGESSVKLRSSGIKFLGWGGG